MRGLAWHHVMIRGRDAPANNLSEDKMKTFKIIGFAVIIITVASLGLTGINILQKGGDYKGQTIDAILGMPAEKATAADIERLSKAEIFQLFYAAPAPDFKEMNGEFKALTISAGVMASSADFFTHHFFGAGHWEGKAFFPFEAAKGWGYNLFAGDSKDAAKMIRMRKMNTYIGPSTIDNKPSFHLDYSPYNTGAVRSMHDELRKINDRLYLGMGHMALGGGRINPAPFVLIGPPAKWVGPDK